MNSIEQEHNHGAGLRQREIDWLIAQGVSPLGLAKTYAGEFRFILIDRVAFLPSGKFEFERYLRDVGEAVPAFTLVVDDVAGEIADILAWHPASGRVATWRKAVSLLGEEQIETPRLGEHLTVHDGVMAWLRAERRGVVVLDNKRAAWRLHGCGPIVVDSVDHGMALRKHLAIAAPEILVSQTAGAAA